MSTTELLPCPFCGGAARFGQCAVEDADDPNAGAEYIECDACSACTALVFPLMESAKPLLAERWNRRASQAQQPAPAQPVAWIESSDIETLEADGWCVVHSARCDPGSDHCADVPLYPAAAAVQPPDDKRALSEISRRALTAEARVRELEEAAAAVQPPVVPLTERERKLIHFALWRFMNAAYSEANDAAQDKTGRYGEGAAQAFTRDARDAENLLPRFGGIGSVPPSDNPDSCHQDRRSGGGVRTEGEASS